MILMYNQMYSLRARNISVNAFVKSPIPWVMFHLLPHTMSETTQVEIICVGEGGKAGAKSVCVGTSEGIRTG